MLALKCTMLTPYDVLKASGHVDKFADYMCKDPKKKKKQAKAAKTAVKLDDSVKKEYEHLLATLDDCTGDDMGALIKKHDIRNPTSGNEVEPPVSVNLMFQTQIGATGKDPAFLRPET